MNTPSATGGTPDSEGHGQQPPHPTFAEPPAPDRSDTPPVTRPDTQPNADPDTHSSPASPDSPGSAASSYGYASPDPRYQAPPPGYYAGPPGYPTPAPGYAAVPPGYVSPPPGYVAVPPGYPVPPPGYVYLPSAPGRTPGGRPPLPTSTTLPPGTQGTPVNPEYTGPGGTVTTRDSGSTRDTVTTVVSWLGAAILILGLVFLTAQAVQHGWLGPSVAVTVAAAISLAVIGAALFVRQRTPGNPVAPALLTVGVLGLLSDIWVTVFGLEWTDVRLGTGLAALTCAVGLGIARWWEQQWLAFILLVTGSLFIFPTGVGLAWDSDDVSALSVSLLILGVLGWSSTWRRNWIPVDIAAAAVFFGGLILAAPDDLTVVITVAAFVAVSVVGVLGLTPTATTSPVAVTVDLLTRWIPASLLPVVFLLAETGDAAFRDGQDSTAPRWCALGIAVFSCVVPLVRQILVREPFTAPDRMTGAGALLPGQYPGTVPLAPAPPATATDSMRAGLATGLAGLALVLSSNHAASAWSWWLCALVVIAGVLVWFSPFLSPLYPWLFGGFTVLVGLPLLAPAWDRFADVPTRALWLPAALYLVLGVLVYFRAGPLHLEFVGKILCGGVFLVLGTSSIPLLARDIDPGEVSFMTGHLVVSVLWMLIGVYFLLRVDARIGLGIALLATAKLVLYDLGALDGLIQVAAFILCGLILLASAAVRGRNDRASGQSNSRR